MLIEAPSWFNFTSLDGELSPPSISIIAGAYGQHAWTKSSWSLNISIEWIGRDNECFGRDCLSLVMFVLLISVGVQQGVVYRGYICKNLIQSKAF